MKFIWARSGEGKYHLSQLHIPYISLRRNTMCGVSLRGYTITRNHEPPIEECCKNCLKMIEGFRNMHHPVYKPSYDWGLKKGETKAIKNIYGSIIRPGEVVIAYDYCMYCKGNMPVVQREGLGKVCARCNATWK